MPANAEREPIINADRAVNLLESYGGSPALIAFLQRVTDAHQIRYYSGSVVPNPLQTGPYSEATIQVALSDGYRKGLLDIRTGNKINTAEMVQAGRQKVGFWIGEATLRNVIGGPEVHKAQLAALASNENPYDIRVVPFSAGSLLTGAVVELMDPHDKVTDVYLSHMGGADMLTPDEGGEFARVAESLRRVRRDALDATESQAFLAGVAQELYS